MAIPMKSSSPVGKTPVLKQFAGGWTLTHQPSKEKEWTLEEKFQQAKKAGFDAMGGGTDPQVVALCEKYGMDYVCYVDGNENYLQAARVNVQLLNHDTLPAVAVKLWIKMEAEAKKLGLNLDLEVHRDTCTETPEKTYEIADRYKKATGKKIRMCFDFSHFAVVKHLYAPFAERLLDHPDLVQLSRQVHFRPFNGHHCQVPATDGKGNETPEFKDYLAFVDAFIACWLKGAKGGEVLYAIPEYGPFGSGYGLSNWSNVWEDAILLRAKTEAIWKANLKKWKK
jgi:sugar phosphate isomerase/epimerase